MQSLPREVVTNVSYTHTLEPERKIVRIVAAGASDFESTRAEMRAVAADPAFGKDFGVLVDARGIRRGPTNGEIAELAKAWIRLAAPRPVVFVVSDALHVGLANMFAILVSLDGAPVEVFRDLSEAEGWLSPMLPTDREA